MKHSIVKAVYDVFKDKCPRERHEYSASGKSPVPAYRIMRVFKRWNNFLAKYDRYCQENKVVEVKPTVAPKPTSGVATKPKGVVNEATK